MRDFRGLEVWQVSHRLTLEVYAATRAFPREEQLGLTNQLRRAAASIPANIAEGCGRATESEFRQFLNIAMGSASELDYHLLLAHDLGYLNDESYAMLATEATRTKKMLSSFIVRLRARPNGQHADLKAN